MTRRNGTKAAVVSLAVVSLAVAAAVASCSTAPSPPASTRSGSAGPVTPSAPSPASGTPAPTGTTPGASTPAPTWFSPTDPSGYSLTGAIAVEPALQDPFSNLLMRGALHERPVVLDVVGTPDYPVAPGAPATVLFATCKCPSRGQGMHLTVEDGSAILAADGGAVRLRGTFRPVQTAADAFTLRRP